MIVVALRSPLLCKLLRSIAIAVSHSDCKCTQQTLSLFALLPRQCNIAGNTAACLSIYSKLHSYLVLKPYILLDCISNPHIESQ